MGSYAVHVPLCILHFGCLRLVNQKKMTRGKIRSAL